MAGEILTLDALQTKLQEILVRGSLHRNFFYEGRDCHFTDDRAVNSPRFSLLPQALKMFCNHHDCKQVTLWDVNEAKVYFFSGFIQHRRYDCRNCGQKHAYYSFIWQEQKERNLFVKVGQSPPMA